MNWSVCNLSRCWRGASAAAFKGKAIEVSVRSAAGSTWLTCWKEDVERWSRVQISASLDR